MHAIESYPFPGGKDETYKCAIEFNEMTSWKIKDIVHS